MIANMSSTNPDDLIRFISGYGSPEPPQSIEEIQGDFQLAGLSTLLNSYLSRIPESKILDIGCGNGVLVAKLAEINAFKDYPNIEYIGFDIQDKLPGAFATVNRLMLHSRIKLLPTGIKWTEYVTTPCIIIVRNVFHELKIDEAARLIHEICMSLPTNSVVLFQDMVTLPIAEKMKAGWLGVHLANIFEKGGIKANHTPDTSKRGVDVFLIEGQRHAPCKLTEKNIRELLIAARKEQLGILSLKYETMEEKPENKLPLSRLTHDIAAISLALKQSGETWLGYQTKDAQTVASTFSLAFSNLSNHELDELQKNFKYPEIKGFQNRGYHIDALDKFLRSDKAIFILKAGPYMGKKTVIWWALFQKLKHNRLPLFVNLKEGGDIFSIMEDVAVQLGIGRFIDVEVLSSLQDLPTEELRIVISEALTPIAAKTILIVDGFENGIDPEGKIENKDIEWLIDFWSSLDKSKLIIETRLEVKQLPFERCQLEYMTNFPSIGQKKHLYTIQ
ncbi:MAG: class I SAM-dependent methyltransferase, partial [Candidatus Subteraquimicrobiales bacterium]|nr:class I SAM-dependent methyltransferase [Candidatus Subteraquimicrobiales bacterium]